MLRIAVVATVLLFATAGCGGDDPSSDSSSAGHDHAAMEHDDGATSTSFGQPGDPAAATTSVEVTATDRLTFEPAAVDVSPGDTVTFVVTNAGKLPHEFVLGDEAYQESHAAGMAAGGHPHGDNGISLEPGETRELTWTFPAGGDVIFACHVDGHFGSGMRGVVRVG